MNTEHFEERTRVRELEIQWLYVLIPIIKKLYYRFFQTDLSFWTSHIFHTAAYRVLSLKAVADSYSGCRYMNKISVNLFLRRIFLRIAFNSFLAGILDGSRSRFGKYLV